MKKLGAVEYLNARPLWDAFAPGNPREGAFELSLSLPSEVARKLAEDEVAAALMPVAAAASFGGLELSSSACIGTFGPVRSVLLVSEAPLSEVGEVALDLSSRTSVVLARLLLKKRKVSPRFFGASSAEAIAKVGGKTAAVVIGDPALALEGRFPHVLDLGAAWREDTGLPFVFAAWFSRPGALTPDDVAELEAAKAWGLGERRRLAAQHAEKTGLSEGALVSYLEESLRYDLDDQAVRGLERFLDEAASEGLLPRTRFSIVRPTETRRVARPSLDTVLARAEAGERLSGEEGLRLLEEASLFDLGLLARGARMRKNPAEVVTYIVDRNVNYTNVCTTSCRFCAFYRKPGHPEAYVLTREQLGQKLQEVKDKGGVQILLQGGLNPDLRIEWYEDLFRWMKSEYGLGLHALSPEEILHIAQMEGLTVQRVLERLHAAGLDSVPGGGAEILVDRVRRRIAKTKCTSEEWLSVMRTAHTMGLRSSATMMYGTIDTARERILHLLKIRDLQDETGGFTAFFCWDYQFEEGTHILPGEHGTLLYLRQQAVARLMLDNVDHVGASWVTQGPEVGQVALLFGADDFGSVMFEENVVSSAGTTFRMDATGMEARIRAAGYKATRRNVRYDWLTDPS
jgi:cyclic dehypoxanthinyl futalosine synthase